MTDPFQYTIRIEDFGMLLLWLMIICFSGFCITGWIMMVTSRFFLHRHTLALTGDEADKKEGKRFSIIAFELPFSYTKFNNLLGNITDKTKDIIRLNLKLDYLFMPFAYLLMFFTGWYILHQQHYHIQQSSLYKLLFVPFTAWLFDILENKMAFACLKKNSVPKARLLLIFSLVKWLLIISYIIVFTVISTRLVSFN